VISKTLDVIRQKTTLKPKLGIVLGSGLGRLAESIEGATRIPYSELPGFLEASIKGHGGELIIGTLEGCPVACLSGRSHLYENIDYAPVRHYVRTLRQLGCENFLATNATGSLREDIGPGELLLVSDHINFQPGNPLAGPNDDSIGPRFLDLTNAYDKDTRHRIRDLADNLNIRLPEGIYIAVLGPSYETTAEIRAFKILGADVVGMSTVPEVIVANHCGLKVSVISIITNFATGLSKTHHSHDEVVAMADKAAVNLTRLVKAFAQDLVQA